MHCAGELTVHEHRKEGGRIALPCVAEDVLGTRVEAKNEAENYYSHRARFNELVRVGQWNTAEAAQVFYYLNRTCFNGLCRFNQNGEFNVPFGSHKSITYDREFSQFRSALSNWTFSSVDLESLPTETDDFIYADPPYDVEFTTYSAGGFSWDDQVRTAEWLAAHRGPVVLSNQATPRIIKLYKKLGFEISYLAGPRRISCTGDRTAAIGPGLEMGELRVRRAEMVDSIRRRDLSGEGRRLT